MEAVRDDGPELVDSSGDGARPRSGAIFVDAAGLVDEDQPLGWRSSWSSNHAMRRRKTCPRCCSAACAVFFEPYAAPVEDA